MTAYEITSGDRTVVVESEDSEALAAAVAEALQAARSAPSRVEITNGGRQVIVEADRDMTDVANTALQLYRDTNDGTADDTPSTTISLGFHTAYADDDPDDNSPEALRRKARV